MVLGFVTVGLVAQYFRFAEEEEGVRREIIEKTGGSRRGVAVLRGGLFEQAEFAGGRDDDFGNFLARHLAERIEVAQGFQFVAEKFQADGEAAGEGPQVNNTAAQGNGAFERDLGFWLVALRLEPFDQIQRVGAMALLQAAGAAREVIRGQGFFKQRGDAGDDEGGARGGLLRQGDESFQAFADVIDLRQAGFLRQNFPGGVEERRR